MTIKTIKIIFITLILFTANTMFGQTVINKQEIVSIINTIRAKGCNCGDEKMPPVAKIKWNDKLQKAAQIQSDFMGGHKVMSHSGNNGSSVTDRLKAVGYNWRTYAENVGFGQDNVETVIYEWVLLSPGHCKTIMSYKYTEIGLANNGKAWTLVLASPKGYNW